MISTTYKNRLISTLFTDWSSTPTAIERMGTFIKIQTPLNEQPVSIDFYDHQRLILRSVEKHNTTMVLKGRQVGATTTFLIAALNALLHHNKHVVYVTPNNMMTKYAADRLTQLLKHINVNVEVERNVIYIPSHNSWIRFENALKDPKNRFRGITINLLIFDEITYINSNLFAMWLWELKPSMIHNQGHTLISSSAGSKDHLFAKLWYSKDETISRVFVPSTCCLREDTINNMKHSLSSEHFKQEVLCSFGE